VPGFVLSWTGQPSGFAGLSVRYDHVSVYGNVFFTAFSGVYVVTGAAGTGPYASPPAPWKSALT
jgi:hypothetical protein